MLKMKLLGDLEASLFHTIFKEDMMIPMDYGKARIKKDKSK